MIAEYAAMTEDEQFAAVAWGDKPICTVSKKHETSLPHIEVELKVKYSIDGKQGSYPITDYIYYQRGQQDNAKEVARLFQKEKLTKSDHRKLGRLLGYKKYEIEAWVNGLERSKHEPV